MTSSAVRQLYLPPPVSRFGRADLQGLIDKLTDSVAVTQMDGVGSPDTLKLSDDCFTLDGAYRYTSDGFRQISRLLGPGVSRLIPDLTGTRARNIPDDFLHGPMAINFFNQLINIRFAAFSPYRLVKNTRTQMIDGLIGQTHRSITNLTFFQIVEETLHSVSPRPEFWAGAVIGRRVVTWWRSPTPFLSYRLDSEEWRFHLGFYFRNDEITGAAARASLTMMGKPGVCLAPFRQFGASVKHQGKDFAQRLASEVQRVVSQTPPLDEWRAKIPQVLSQTLGFSTGSNHKARRQRMQAITRYLKRAGVDSTVAQEIIDAALHCGRRVGQRPELLDPVQEEELFTSRTVVDLLVCLLHLSRRLDIPRREVLEQAAFHLVTGKSW
jgi:hypothetical protein